MRRPYSTGNNGVAQLEWSAEHATLLAVTSCNHINRHGHSYADVRAGTTLAHFSALKVLRLPFCYCFVSDTPETPETSQLFPAQRVLRLRAETRTV